MAPGEDQPPNRGRNHWWSRPGWRAGRHFYACHLTLDDQPQLCELVRQYQDALVPLPGLALIPPQWLHLTMQGIGFADEISAADLAAVTRRIEQRLRAREPPMATFHRASVWREAVVLKAAPQDPLCQLRLDIHDAITSVLGPAKFSEPRPGPGQFTPHVSAAYVDNAAAGQPIADAISNTGPPAVTATFNAASMLVFHRDHRTYEWAQATPLPIGPAR